MGEGFWFYIKAMSLQEPTERLWNVAQLSHGGVLGRAEVLLRTPLTGGSSPEQQFTTLLPSVPSCQAKDPGQHQGYVRTVKAESFCVCHWVRGNSPFTTLVPYLGDPDTGETVPCIGRFLSLEDIL